MQPIRSYLTIIEAHASSKDTLRESLLTELANAPYRYIVKSKIGRSRSNLFQTEDKRVFMVNLAAETREDREGVNLTFADANSRHDLSISGGGDAFRIFSTITTILADYVKEQKPEYIIFSADVDEESRVTLYDKFAKRLPSKIGNYTLKSAWRDEHDKYYYIERNVTDQ